MGKAEYLARKKWEGNLAEEMEVELAGLEAEEEGLRIYHSLLKTSFLSDTAFFGDTL
mgnify:CR=1 FL=1